MLAEDRSSAGWVLRRPVRSLCWVCFSGRSSSHSQQEGSPRVPGYEDVLHGKELVHNSTLMCMSLCVCVLVCPSSGGNVLLIVRTLSTVLSMSTTEQQGSQGQKECVHVVVPHDENMFPKEVVQCPSWEMLKAGVNVTLGNLI